MATFYVMEAVNLYLGDLDPTNSTHLELEELKLPALEEIMQEHHAGGALVKVEYSLGIEALKPTFKLKGWNPVALGQFGLGSRMRHSYTAYGVIRDKRTGRAIEAKSVIEARLGKVESDAFKRGDLQGHDYAFNEVMHYELHIDGAEKYFFDNWTSDWRVNGLSENADERRILRIPGV